VERNGKPIKKATQKTMHTLQYVVMEDQDFIGVEQIRGLCQIDRESNGVKRSVRIQSYPLNLVVSFDYLSS